MANGLTITIKEFIKLNASRQNTILFENTESIKTMLTNQANTFEDHVKKDWLHQRLTYIGLTALAILLGLGKYIGYI